MKSPDFEPFFTVSGDCSADISASTSSLAVLYSFFTFDYVDICLNGCLELEATYPLAKEAGFAATFLKTCSDWSKYWVNDRIYPRRAFIYVP
ncbi:MAG TPA: hypothetical protein VFM05_09765, partial [Candidatus Saccharimonadales bacterium]|nr:hypothetical protein [Candidatus Saccharimonadales bacterium]